MGMKKLLVILLLCGCTDQRVRISTIPEATPSERLAVMEYFASGDIEALSADLSLAEMRREK